MKEKGRFAGKGKSILGTERPTGLADFLENSTENQDVRISENTEIRNAENTEIRTEPRLSAKVAREEFRFTEDLAERLRKCAFEKRRKKVEIVTQALEQFLKQEGF